MNLNEAEAVTEIPIPTATPVMQLSVFLHNRVGTFMALVKLLNDHKIEVLGLSMQETTELTFARLVLSDPESAITLFMEKGIPHADCKVLVVEIREGAHNLALCLAALLTAEINIQFSYPMMTRVGNWPLLVLHVDDREVAADALNSSGFKLVGQNELSR
ncbi:MAG: amino acid-binding [Verrucomicrobiaceae bacterium]|nr:amino acid-binding [Verrucomicrobiaceae bacterium]MDB6120012.1 amino acid-binding [Verrucomicrobiaceae bacterium]